MGLSEKIRRNDKRSFISLLVVFTMLLSMISSGLAKPVEAKTSREAIIVEVEGSVSVKKAGGSKSFTAYKDMSLSQGDTIITGSASSVVLKIADHEDELTIGSNAEMNISDLSNQGSGKTSKFKTWAGSMWIKVKSLVSSEDQFEVETPTAVMGVRGTQLYAGVDPDTGSTIAAVGAGKVLTSTVVNGDGNQQETNETLLLPSQQIDLNSRDEVKDLSVKVSLLDIAKLVENASPKVLEALIRNKAEIDRENKEFIDKKIQEINGNSNQETNNTSLVIKSLDVLDKVSKNLDNLIGNIAIVALEQKKIDPEKMAQVIQEANNKIDDPNKKLDLNKVEKLDPKAGVDPELDKLKQAELAKLNTEQARLMAEQQKLLQEQLQKLQSILDTIEKDLKRVEDENKKSKEEETKKLESDYLKTLSDPDKQRFEADKQRTENQSSNNSTTPTTTTPTTTNTTPSQSQNSGNTSRVVAAPTVTSPTGPAVITQGAVQLKLRAEAATLIEVLNGDKVIASAQSNGSEDTVINIDTLTNGEYNLTARAVRGAATSPSVKIPQITINYPSAAPTLVPEITFTEGNRVGSTVNLNLSMKNFTDSKQFYAVEAHLVYDKSLNYTGTSNELPDEPGTVFDGATKSAETLRQVSGTAQNEIIYAASQFEATGSAAVANLTVSAEKPLVKIPLTIMSTASADKVKVDLVYVKVVNKNGDTVAEFTTPKTIFVTIR